MFILVSSLLPLVSSLRLGVYERNISRCTDLGELYYPEDGQCYLPLSRGPCAQDWILVLSERGVGSCQFDPCACEDESCSTGQVLYEGQCLEPRGLESCRGPGQILRWTIMGQGVCDCEDGWGPIEGEDGCFQQSSTGPCNEGEIVREKGRVCSLIGLYETLRIYEELGQEEYREATLKLRQLNCGRGEQWDECCRLLTDETPIPMVTEDVLNAQPFLRPRYMCGPNSTPSGDPCPPTHRPWPSVSASTCFPLLDGSSVSEDCILSLSPDHSYLSCEEAGTTLLFARPATARCPKKGEFYSRFKEMCL